MKKLLLALLLFPSLLAAQNVSKKDYKRIDAASLSEKALTDDCSFRMVKVVLTYAGGGQKLDADKGKIANQTLQRCRLRTTTTNWMVGSTEVSFRDSTAKQYWIYSDNDQLNFHKWVAGKNYVLYLKVLKRENMLLFLDAIESEP
jgi:hypothetical protein